MIRNSGEEIIYKVINCGADDITSFVSSFSEQCYSTCSNTKREILLNNDWNENEVVSKFSPILFQFRSKMLLDQKEEISKDLSNTIFEISEKDQYIAKNIECAARLYRIFCDDRGGQDILVTNELAKSLNNEILNAQMGIKAAETAISGKSIFAYDKNSKVAKAYEEFTKEVLKLERKEKNRLHSEQAR